MTAIQRSSGILLHITSLPTRFGIGDLGPAARRFADFLQRAQQRLWQILPLNPIMAQGDYSPYTSWSAFAGNTLLISPEDLVEDGFIAAHELAPLPACQPKRVDFACAEAYKARLLDAACARFQAQPRHRRYADFGRFCGDHNDWLHDAARFKVLHDHFKGAAWSHWPDELKRRKLKALQQVDRQFRDELIREKFLQFLFDRQWRRLRAYCTAAQVQLFGDIPIYVTHDSADVWTYPGLFKLDQNLRPTAVSGVPPDYFSATGQLWGHPVYHWENLQKSGYDWWLRRIGHNMACFDWIRIDHFRGLVAFWEVPADHTTAVAGQWVQAPAADFMACLLRRYPLLPMVAEDLGLITSDVRAIMQRFAVPGMRVALFGFGTDFPHNTYLPHNMEPRCVYFTGTHDTNTVRGWLQQEASATEKHNLSRYLGHAVRSADLHWDLLRLVMGAPACMALFPMQDVLGLGASARMNRPGRPRGNWRWRLELKRLSDALADQLAELTVTFGRGG